jgi:hypothetical protein
VCAIAPAGWERWRNIAPNGQQTPKQSASAGARSSPTCLPLMMMTTMTINGYTSRSFLHELGLIIIYFYSFF